MSSISETTETTGTTNARFARNLTSPDAKRTDDLDVKAIQHGNQAWWSTNPMSYDWHGENALPMYSREWFDEIDRRFVTASRLFATDHTPFDRLIPFERLKGARVLEIGCGMGFHSEMFARAGAKLTAVDLTDTAVRATTERFKIRNLQGTIIQGDAEELPFADKSFDFVWSWGVIHHSSRTARIVRQMARVLQPNGECRVMVYSRDGIMVALHYLFNHVLGGSFLRHSFEETLYRKTDGFSARYYVKDQFEDLFRAFFAQATGSILGQEADAVPLPRQLRNLAMRFVSEDYLRDAQSKRGAFLFLKANSPI